MNESASREYTPLKYSRELTNEGVDYLTAFRRSGAAQGGQVERGKSDHLLNSALARLFTLSFKQFPDHSM